jgi:transcriptional regulator of aromatic amino acid metabolism
VSKKCHGRQRENAPLILVSGLPASKAEDLFYRINTRELRVPALRERPAIGLYEPARPIVM